MVGRWGPVPFLLPVGSQYVIGLDVQGFVLIGRGTLVGCRAACKWEPNGRAKWEVPGGRAPLWEQTTPPKPPPPHQLNCPGTPNRYYLRTEYGVRSTWSPLLHSSTPLVLRTASTEDSSACTEYGLRGTTTVGPVGECLVDVTNSLDYLLLPLEKTKRTSTCIFFTLPPSQALPIASSFLFSLIIPFRHKHTLVACLPAASFLPSFSIFFLFFRLAPRPKYSLFISERYMRASVLPYSISWLPAATNRPNIVSHTSDLDIEPGKLSSYLVLQLNRRKQAGLYWLSPATARHKVNLARQ